MTNFNLPQKINILGESWELIKNANDPSVGFPYERVNTIDFDCSEVRQGLYRILVTGNIQPMQGSLEKPLRLTFIGFNNTPIYQRFLTRNDLRKMSIYKADIGKFAEDFTNAFFGQNAEQGDKYNIQPTPDLKGMEDGGRNADDE